MEKAPRYSLWKPDREDIGRSEVSVILFPIEDVEIVEPQISPGVPFPVLYPLGTRRESVEKRWASWIRAVNR